MHIEQFDAGRMYSLLSQLAKFADLPPNAWSDHEVAVRKLAKWEPAISFEMYYPLWIRIIPIKSLRRRLEKWYWEHGGEECLKN